MCTQTSIGFHVSPSRAPMNLPYHFMPLSLILTKITIFLHKKEPKT